MIADLEFINALELENSSLPNGKEQGFVDAGSMVSFTESLSSQNKEDVLNGTLLAQLAANKKFNRYKDTGNWYKFYVNVLEKIGWVVHSFKFTQFQNQKSTLKISSLALDLIKAAIGEGEFLKTVEKTISSIEKSGEDVALFSKTSYSGQNGNFQIVPCTTDKSGQVIAAFMGGYFSASESAQNYFFFTFKNQEIKFFYSVQTLTLNESVYAQVREMVKNKLGDKAKEFIKDLDI